MTLDQTISAINRASERMTELYGKPVFDELAIVVFDEKGGKILSYAGPRKAGFHENFNGDLDTLRSRLMTLDHHLGDFEFAREASGTLFDAFMTLGDGVYLICNNVNHSMSGIAKDPRWLAAQVPFAELGDVFRHNPLVCDW